MFIPSPNFSLLVLAGFCLGLTETKAVTVSLADVPPAVQKTIQSQLAGGSVSKIERVEEGGESAYEVKTKIGKDKEREFTVAPGGALLAIEITMAELPAVLQKAIKNAVGPGQLEGIDKTFEDGEIIYTAGITLDGREHDSAFKEDGALQRVEVDSADLPVSVAKAISAQVGLGKVYEINKNLDADGTTYTASIVQNGREHDVTFAEDGVLSSIEVDKADLPAAAQTTISAQVGTGNLEGIDKTFDNGEVSYEATMLGPDGKDRDFAVSEEGTLISREVILAETPPAVQKTIAKTLGNGKVIRIDQSLDRAKHSYDVEGQKDGKEFDFTVGPRGKFLGMQD